MLIRLCAVHVGLRCRHKYRLDLPHWDTNILNLLEIAEQLDQMPDNEDRVQYSLQQAPGLVFVRRFSF